MRSFFTCILPFRQNLYLNLANLTWYSLKFLSYLGQNSFNPKVMKSRLNMILFGNISFSIIFKFILKTQNIFTKILTLTHCVFPLYFKCFFRSTKFFVIVNQKMMLTFFLEEQKVSNNKMFQLFQLCYFYLIIQLAHTQTYIHKKILKS